MFLENTEFAVVIEFNAHGGYPRCVFNMVTPPKSGASPSFSDSEPVRTELQKVLTSATFRNCEKLCRFLQFVVEHTLIGEADQLKEYRIGVDVLGRPESFDPRLDAAVRLEARRLRTQLLHYYSTEGRKDAIRIEVPTGGYVARFVENSSGVAPKPYVRPLKWLSHGNSTESEHASRSRASLVLLLGLALSVTIVFLYRWHSRRGFPQMQSRSVVVLPFRNLTGRVQNETLSDGLTDELTDSLARIPGLRVLSRSSSLKFRGKAEDIRSIGRELNVGTILKGSVETSGDRLRITMQLFRAVDGSQIWSATYEPHSGETFALDGEISQSVAAELGVNGPEHSENPSTRHTPDRQALALYALARDRWDRRTKSDEWKAIEYFNQAIDQDPFYAQAYVGLAEAYVVLGGNDWAHSSEVYPKARVAAEQALRLDNSLSEAHAALAQIMLFYTWDFPGAEREFRQAVELNPNYATAHQWRGVLLIAERRFDEAAVELRKARDLDPSSLIIAVDLGFVLANSGRYGAAVELGRSVLASDPDYAPAYSLTGFAYRGQGKYKQAVEQYKKYLTLSGHDPNALKELGVTYSVSGQPSKALAIIRQLQASKVGYTPAYDIAALYASLGHKNQAYQWLEAAIRQRAPSCWQLDTDPAFNPLRSEFRFQQLRRLVMQS
jgi:TolB-like protein/tetratricopeptide (TPR) repeat protein